MNNIQFIDISKRKFLFITLKEDDLKELKVVERKIKKANKAIVLSNNIKKKFKNFKDKKKLKRIENIIEFFDNNKIIYKDFLVEILNYNDGCVFTITKVDSDFIENVGNNIFYKFNSFEDFLAFCTYIKNMNWSVFESFSLFLLNNTYYLHSFNNISNDLDTILCEFSNKKDFSLRFFRYFK